jgi:hypothetical protein
MIEEKPKAPSIRKDKEIEIKRMEIDTVNRVISDEDLKTQFSQPERILITLLEEISEKPFSISEKLAEDMNIPFDMHRYRYPLLKETVHGFVRKGKALNRKGIKEDIDIVSAYFQAQIERSKESQKTNTLTK